MNARLVIVGLVVTAGGVATVASLIPGGSAPEPEPAPVAATAPKIERSEVPSYRAPEVREERRAAPTPAVAQRSGNTPARGPLERFDTDGDGMISEAEFAEMWRQREERRAQWEERRQRWEAEADTDGDGEISAEERRAQWAQMRERMEARMIERLTPRFDANGDGVLDADEQAALDAFMDERRAEQEARRQEWEQRLLADYDMNGDGQLGDAEREQAFADMRMRRMQDQQQFVEQFDRNGDGQLDLDESYEAFQTMNERMERGQFVSRYDTDQDGRLSTADLGRYMELYASGDPAADANGDGTVNNADLQAFRNEMMAEPLPQGPEGFDAFGGRGMFGGFDRGGRDGRRGGRGGGGGGGGGDESRRGGREQPSGEQP